MSTTPQYPAMVMIIRHGEKPGNPADETDGGLDLSMAGSARAAALPALFSPDPTATPVSGLNQYSCQVGAGKDAIFTGTYAATSIAAGNPKYPVPDFLFAAQISGSSNRPVETITPLSQYLTSVKKDGTINTTWPDDQYTDLANAVLHDGTTYGGKVILVCWHHGKAPDLAEAFGVPKHEVKPWKPWNPAVFDLVFQITWDSKGKASLNVNYQGLLYGDTAITQTAAA